jgi:hypothetical protein
VAEIIYSLLAAWWLGVAVLAIFSIHAHLIVEEQDELLRVPRLPKAAPLPHLSRKTTFNGEQPQ